MAVQNPISSAALTASEVRPGLKFLWYTPLDDSSLKWGTFRSQPYLDDREECVVDIVLDNMPDEIQTFGLTVMGITPSPHDGTTWSKSLTIPRGESE